MYVGKDYIWYTRNTDIWKRVISHSIYFPYLLLPELKVMGGLLEPITADRAIAGWHPGQVANSSQGYQSLLLKEITPLDMVIQRLK